MVNILRKVLLLNLISLIIIGKLLLMYFIKLSMGIKYLNISHINNCEVKNFIYDDFIDFYNEVKSNNTYYELLKQNSYIHHITNKCEIINKINSINKYYIINRNFKLKIFISTILLIFIINYIFIKYFIFKNKKNVSERLSFLNKDKIKFQNNDITYGKKNN